MENETFLIDAYAVAVGIEYYEDEEDFQLKEGQEVIITSNKQVLLNGSKIGSIASNDKYYENAGAILNILYRDSTIKHTGEDYFILGTKEIFDYFGEGDEIKTRVVYTNGKTAMLYMGTKPIQCFIPESEKQLKTETRCNLCDKEFEDFINYVENMFTLAADAPIEVDTQVQAVCEEKQTKREENKTMKNLFGKGFGKCDDTRFSLSMNGIAVRKKDSNEFVVYNKERHEFVDTTDMLINLADSIFVLPATEVAEGDTIIHEGKPYFILEANEDGSYKSVSYDDCTQAVLIPKTTMFGLKYFTKVFSLFGDNFASNGEMFNNPLMLMSLINSDKDTDMSKLLLMSSLSNGDAMNNPMLMSMLLKDGDSSDLSSIMMMSMMSGGQNPFAPKAPKTTKASAKTQN